MSELKRAKSCKTVNEAKMGSMVYSRLSTVTEFMDSTDTGFDSDQIDTLLDKWNNTLSKPNDSGCAHSNLLQEIIESQKWLLQDLEYMEIELTPQQMQKYWQKIAQEYKAAYDSLNSRPSLPEGSPRVQAAPAPSLHENVRYSRP